MSLTSLFPAGRLQPPVRRVLAVDAGSRNLKLLVAESGFGRLRILKEERIDLRAEGLVSADETKALLQATLAEWGGPPLALALPQHLSISQVIEVPVSAGDDVEAVIRAETVKLGGVSESRIVHDSVPLAAPANNRREYWVTLAQEGDILDRIARLGMEGEDLCEVAPMASALISAYRSAAPLSSRAILVHLGAQTTVVVVLIAGEGAFAASFQMGGDFFTRGLARLQGGSEETAEALKRERDLFHGGGVEGFVEVVDGWAAELKRQLNDWFDHNPGAAAEAASFELIASGGGFDQPGLLDYLRAQAGLNLRPWPRNTAAGLPHPSPLFEVAFGTALQALGYSPQPVSLLPEAYRAGWRRRQGRRRLEYASAALLAVAGCALLLGTWRQSSLLVRKQALLTQVQTAQQTLKTNTALTAELQGRYDNLRSLLAAERNTADTLGTLALLRQCRSNRSFWYVLVADQQSYFTLPVPTGTNRPARIGPAPDAPASDRSKAIPPDSFVGPLPPTNPAPARPGLIAELCVPEDSEASRRTLAQLVNQLKPDPRFSKVDLLSDDLHRGLADPKLVLPDRHFVLALDFAATDFCQPLPVKRTAVPGPRAPGKRPPRGGRGAPDPEEKWSLAP